MDDLLADFLTETQEGLGALDAALVRLERAPDDMATLSEVFRIVHTIKGTCGFLGLARMEGVAHAAENVLGRYRDGTVPDVDVDPALAGDFDGLADRVADRMDRVELTPALDDIWQRVRRLNRYVEETAPWVLAKDEADPARLDEVLYNLVDGLRVVTLMLVPYLPETAESLLGTLAEEGRGLAESGLEPA